MRYKKPFVVFPRVLKTGKKVYYYQTYDQNGKRTAPKSTGQTTKTAAETYCCHLIKESTLIPEKKNLIVYFKDFAKNWFIYDKCEYIQSRLEREFTYSRTYAYIQRLILNKHILPAFEKIKMIDISEKMIETWLLSMKRKSLSNKTINHCFKILRLMLKEATRQEIVDKNP